MAIIVVLICIVAIILLPYWIIPVNPFPKPSGKWNVGTSNLIWDSANHSGIIAKVWYPTDIESVAPSPYLDRLGQNFSSNIVINLLLKLNFRHLLFPSVTHVSFMDLPLVINPTFSKMISLFGKADGLDLLQRTARVTMDFFNKQT
jgi:hypothetical protein